MYRDNVSSFLKCFDLALTVLSTLLCILFVFAPPLSETPVRIILALPLVLFLPGYSLVATLFPRRDDLDGVERVALSFGMSIAIAPLFGFALNYTPFGIRLAPVLAVLSMFTISLSLLAWVRRMKLPPEQEFRFPFESLFKVKRLFVGQSVIDKILSVILVASMIAASAVLVYVIAIPKTGERFTEFYILGPNGTASNYPTNLKAGEEAKLTIGIINNEYKNITYRLEMKLNGTIIHEEYASLTHDQEYQKPMTFKTTKTGEHQKLEFLLYKNEEKEAYRTLHLWIDVT